MIKEKSISKPYSKHSQLDFLIVLNEKAPASHDYLSNWNSYVGMYWDNNYKRKNKTFFTYLVLWVIALTTGHEISPLKNPNDEVFAIVIKFW